MSLLQQAGMGWVRQRYGNDHGIALVSALMFLTALALVGGTAATIMTWSRQISGNYKASIQAFEAAESGAEEARARLRGNATSLITDTAPTQTQWQAYIGSATQVQAYGYTGSSQQVQTNSLQNSLQYAVKIVHATDSAGNILYWGDPTGTGINTRNITTGQNIYVVTSYGTAGGAHSTVQKQVTRTPSLPIPGTLYVSAPTTIQGSSTNIIGQDDCGSVNTPGIGTPLGNHQPNGHDTIEQNGNPNISGTPPIRYGGTTLNIQGIVNGLKGGADFSYDVQSATQTASTTPGPADHWGTPTAGATLQRASSCSEYHTVYYNTHGTYLHLSGGVTGCGILVVEGDLELHGNFSWYGAIVVTGSIIYTGGGNKNSTGAVLSGGSVTADVIGGNANVVNCSEALQKQTQTSPLRVLSWGTL